MKNPDRATVSQIDALPNIGKAIAADPNGWGKCPDQFVDVNKMVHLAKSSLPPPLWTTTSPWPRTT
jgi:hypothetical protein